MAEGREPGETAEHRLIAELFRPIASHPGALGLADDAAVLAVESGQELVVTKDALVAGVHFFPDDPPAAIAQKALRVNLSDLAAKGAEPLGFLLAIAVAPDLGADWLRTFASGLSEDAERYGCGLLGGDTVRTPGPLTLSITALGSVPAGRMVRRAGASAGDHVLVSGTIGDAALGLLLRRDPGLADRWELSGAERDHLLERYLRPQPRMALAKPLLGTASAAMDVSDGLAGDLAKLCRVSGVSACVTGGELPLSRAARKALAADPSLLASLLTGGDDYEILCTVPAGVSGGLIHDATGVGIALTCIGEVTSLDKPLAFLGPDGEAVALDRLAFDHF